MTTEGGVDHLVPDARPAARLPDAERIALVRTEQWWITHEQAQHGPPSPASNTCGITPPQCPAQATASAADLARAGTSGKGMCAKVVIPWLTKSSAWLQPGPAAADSPASAR